MLNWHWMCDRDADRGWDSCWGWLVPWEDPLSIQATPRLYSCTENYCLPCCCHYSEVMVCPSPQDCCCCCGKVWQTFQPASQKHIQQIWNTQNYCCAPTFPTLLCSAWFEFHLFLICMAVEVFLLCLLVASMQIFLPHSASPVGPIFQSVLFYTR